MQSFKPTKDLNLVQDYLTFLGISHSGCAASCTLSFLTQLLRAHLRRIPYENISKFTSQPSFPNGDFNFRSYFTGIQEAAFGGTCFAQSQGFCELLCALGFSAQIVLAKEGPKILHPAICVTLTNQTRYLIDLGLCADFVGPFPIAANHRVQTRLGNRHYHFAVNETETGFSLWIVAGRSVVRSFQGTLTPCSRIELAELTRTSSARSSIMMQHLCIHQVFEDSSGATSKMIWDRSYIETCGGSTRKIEIPSADDLAKLAEVTYGFNNKDIIKALEHLKTTLRF